MGIFDSTANTQFNSFGSPLNPMNTNQGNWGMNANYLTPSFTAPYRPAYQGGHVANHNPGFFGGAFGLSGMSGMPPYGVGNENYEQSAWDAVGNKPADFGMAGAQRFFVPLAAYGGAFAFSKAWQVPTTNSAVQQAKWMFGGPSARAAARAGQTINVSGFTQMGTRFGEGLARGVIGGASTFAPNLAASGAARGAITAAGALGGAAGWMGGPLLAAQGAITLADKMIFDNYIGVRENSAALRSNFSQVTFGGNYGDPYSGQGLSRRHAGRMGGELTSFAARDQQFNAREVASMTSMSAQMGLLDNVNPEQLTTRMKSIVQQVKMVMSIAGTTDFKEALGMMAKLQMGGAGPGQLAGITSGIGAFASASGISTNRMFNTVGAQGQYLFQANGLTPYLGQLAAGSSMAGMASAFRTGLISTEQMARMGGVEGATQASLTGQVNAAQTTYQMMANYNRFTSGVGGRGVVENVANFGRSFAGDPLRAYGAMMRTGRANISEMIKEDGGLGGVYNQMIAMADINPLTANRKLDQDQVFALLMQMTNNDHDQSQALLQEFRSAGDAKSSGVLRSGFRSSNLKARKDWLDQTEQTALQSLAPIRAVRGAWRGAKAVGADVMGQFESGRGGFVDDIKRLWSDISFGRPADIASLRMSDVGSESLQMPSTDFRGSTSQSNMNINRLLSAHKGDLNKIKDAAAAGDATARAAIRGDERALQALARSGQISAKYATADGAAELSNVISRLPKEAKSDGASFQNLQSALREGPIVGGDDLYKAQGYETATKLYKALSEDPMMQKKETQELMENWKERAHLGGVKDTEVIQGLGKFVRYASEKGISMSNNYLGAKSGEDLEGFMKRTDGVLSPGIKNTNPNVTDEQHFQELMRQQKVDEQERKHIELRNKLIGGGRLDLVASMDTSKAADKLNTAGDKLIEAANALKGTKEISAEKKPGLNDVGRSWNIFGGNRITQGKP